jgi:hypothetical protein
VSRSTWDTSRVCWDFAYGPITLYGRTFQNFQLSAQIPHRGPSTPPGKPDGLGCSPFARHYLGNHGCFLLLRVLRCFTSPGVAWRPYEFRPPCPDFNRGGFPHSEISGSKRVCRSPKLIAAYHVLHRPLMPRHSPCALSSLTKIAFGQFFIFFFGEELYLPSLCNCQRTTPIARGKWFSRIR